MQKKADVALLRALQLPNLDGSKLAMVATSGCYSLLAEMADKSQAVAVRQLRRVARV